MTEIRIAGTRKYQPGGVALASTVGDSEEFIGLRDYRAGDPMRRIHWKSWARVGRPVVKEYLDEFFVRHALVLDTFTSHPGDPVFEEAVSVAASIAVSMRTQESLLDLMFVGPEAYCFTAGRGLAHTEQLLEVLACVGPCRDKPFRSLQHAVIDRLDVLSGCVCVLLGWDEARQELVRQLEVLGAPVLFWGWQTGFLFLALPLAVLVQAARALTWRIELSATDFHRLTDLCTLLILVSGVYLFSTTGTGRAAGADGPRAMTLLFQWLPILLSPLIASQLYSTAGKVPLTAFFWALRRQAARSPETRPGTVDLGYLYFALCILSASAANRRTLEFYLGL